MRLRSKPGGNVMCWAEFADVRKSLCLTDLIRQRGFAALSSTRRQPKFPAKITNAHPVNMKASGQGVPSCRATIPAEPNMAPDISRNPRQDAAMPVADLVEAKAFSGATA